MKLVDLSCLTKAIKDCKEDNRDYYHCSGLPHPILSRQQINMILTNLNLIEKNSFKIVAGGMYENHFMNNDPVNEIERIKKSFQDGNTVVVKNLETYNMELDVLCRAIGNNVDAHMYISPKNAVGFPMHEDDRSVFIFMLYGEKLFKVGGDTVLLEPGDMLYIKQGIKHKAEAIDGSCHISFGLAEVFLDESSISLPIDINLPF